MFSGTWVKLRYRNHYIWMECGVEEEIQGHGVHEMLRSPLMEMTSGERSWSGKGRVFMGKLILTTSLGAVLAKSRASGAE